MSWRHRDILEGELHEPKGFTTANNGDSIWRNEQGLSEWTDREVLPAALNFVDASVAPPTTANGDIYVLSLGASIHANWGTVALKDWVRYDGSSWKVITPSKSILCYDKTLDVLMSYDGSVWASIGGGGGGGDSIYSANGSLSSDRIVNYNGNTLTLDGDTLIKGSDTSVNTTGFKVANSTNASLLEVKNNGQTTLGNSISIPLVINRKSSGTVGNGIDFNAYNSSNVETNFARIIQVATGDNAGSENGGLWFRTMIGGTLKTPVILDNKELFIDGSDFTDNAFRVKYNTFDCLKVTTSKQTYIESGSFNPLVLNSKKSGVLGVGLDFNAYNSSSNEHSYARIVQVATGVASGSENGGLWLRVSDNGSISTKVQIDTDKTDIKNKLELSGGLQVNGVLGFTGTGNFTNFTVVDGIITNAT